MVTIPLLTRRAATCVLVATTPLIIALTTASTATAELLERSGVSIVAAIPAPPTAADDVDAIECPVPDGSEFIDSWGASRSGGRGHQGVDMIADRGTPVVAAETGEIDFKQSRLGGNAAWLNTAAGDSFYYAHLDSFEGSSRRVAAGEVIGYVGSSGNAKGPHLHFETHVDGAAENPFPATFTACVQPVLDAIEPLEASLREMPTTPATGAVDAAQVAQRRDELIELLDI